MSEGVTTAKKTWWISSHTKFKRQPQHVFQGDDNLIKEIFGEDYSKNDVASLPTENNKRKLNEMTSSNNNNYDDHDDGGHHCDDNNDKDVYSYEDDECLSEDDESLSENNIIDEKCQTHNLSCDCYFCSSNKNSSVLRLRGGDEVIVDSYDDAGSGDEEIEIGTTSSQLETFIQNILRQERIIDDDHQKKNENHHHQQQQQPNASLAKEIEQMDHHLSNLCDKKGIEEREKQSVEKEFHSLLEKFDI